MREGRFGPVYVTADGPLRALRIGSATADDQTIIDTRDPRAVPMPYLRTLTAVLLVDDGPRAAAAGPRTVAVLGLGGGGFLAVTDAWPGLAVDGVEIDPAVVALGRAHLGLDARRVRVKVDDARAHLEQGAARGKRPYDVIVVDAYAGDDLPRALTAPSFFTLVRARLAPTGAMAMNLAVADDDERALVARVAGVFPEACLTLRTPVDENLVVIAAPRAIDRAALLARAHALDERGRLPFAVAPEVAGARPCAAPLPRAR